MEITALKTWVFVLIATRLFFDGAEEYFILPTAWYYIKSLNQTDVFLGIVTSAYSISAIIFAPLIGKFADKFGYVKSIVVCTAFVKFAGNLIYSLPFLDALPPLGRIIAGVGDGGTGVLYGQVALYTKQKNMAKIFVFLDGMYVLGASVGPSISSFLTFKVNILGWPIDSGNSPGVVLSLIWFVWMLAACFLPKEFGDNEILAEKFVVSCDDSDDGNSEEGVDMEEKPEVKRTAMPAPTMSTLFCVYYVLFLSLYYSSTAAFYTPLLASKHFHVQFIHIKLLFLASSLFAFVLILSLMLATEYMKAKKLMVLLMLQQAVPIALLAYCAYTWQDVSTEKSYILLFYLCLGMPYFSFGIGASIVSEITDPKDTAFYQSLTYSTGHLAYVVSRISSSHLFTNTTLLFYCVGLTFSWLVQVLWFAIEYGKL